MRSALNVRIQYSVLAALAALSLAVSPARAEKDVALVIGNSAYKNVPTLEPPVNDARAMADRFQKAGYGVVTAYDADLAQFKSALRQYFEQARDADIAVVYYAGHGIEAHGVNYVIPVDATLKTDWDADDELVTLDRLVAATSARKRLGLVILDASRDNPFSPAMKQEELGRGGGQTGLSAVQPAAGNTLIAYAAKAGSPSIDDGPHSVFTTALLDNLFVPGLDVRLAFGRTRDEVLKKTGNRQEPFVYGSLSGDIVSLVPGSLPRASALDDPAMERHDFDLIARIKTKGAWNVFLQQHPDGCYADIARKRVAALDAGGSSSGPANPADETASCEK